MTQPADIRLSFNEVVSTYSEVRPSYPVRLFDDLFALLPSAPRIVEVGPGTGQATRDLLSRGAFVDAVELGPAMAKKLRAELPSDRLRVHVGDFEEFSFDPASADVVFSASAYHWITPRSQVDRPAHILADGGVLAIVDLTQVSAPEDMGFFTAAQPIYEGHGQGHTGPPAPTRDAVDPPIRASLDTDSRYCDVVVRRYDWDQTYTASDYRKLMLTYSGTQMMDEHSRVALLDEMESFIQSDFDGQITRPLVATLTTGDVRRS